MGIAFKTFFASITVLFVAFGKLAGAINFLSAWAEETSGSFYDEAKADREAKELAKEAELTALITSPKAPVSKVKAIKPVEEVLAA